jgi:hypothetical protein
MEATGTGTLGGAKRKGRPSEEGRPWGESLGAGGQMRLCPITWDAVVKGLV